MKLLLEEGNPDPEKAIGRGWNQVGRGVNLWHIIKKWSNYQIFILLKTIGRGRNQGGGGVTFDAWTYYFRFNNLLLLLLSLSLFHYYWTRKKPGWTRSQPVTQGHITLTLKWNYQRHNGPEIWALLTKKLPKLIYEPTIFKLWPINCKLWVREAFRGDEKKDLLTYFSPFTSSHFHISNSRPGKWQIERLTTDNSDFFLDT